MSFDQIIGQETIKTILLQTIEQKRIAHAYLFAGPDGVGKEAMAIEFAKAIFCEASQNRPCNACSACRRIGSFSHPDFFFLFPSNKSVTVENERAVLDSLMEQPYCRTPIAGNPTISIDKIRELRRIGALKPMEKYRVIIIAEADRMTAEAANSLLKMLEEPPNYTYLILCTAHINALLPTIVSRCQRCRFGFLADAEIEKRLIDSHGLSSAEAQKIARIAQGSFRRALDWLQEDLAQQREDAVDLLRCCFKDPMAQLQLVEAFTTRYDKGALKDVLGLILLWLRDALMVKIESPATKANLPVTNFDQLDTLQKFVGAFDEIDIPQCLIEVETAIEQIDRNANLTLVIMALMHRLRSHFQLKQYVPEA